MFFWVFTVTTGLLFIVGFLLKPEETGRFVRSYVTEPHFRVVWLLVVALLVTARAFEGKSLIETAWESDKAAWQARFQPLYDRFLSSPAGEGVGPGPPAGASQDAGTAASDILRYFWYTATILCWGATALAVVSLPPHTRAKLRAFLPKDDSKKP